MFRFLKIALPSFAFGAVAGAALWYLFSPLFIDRVVSEDVTIAASAEVIATGTFVDADRAHSGTGNVEVVRDGGTTRIQFTNFEVTNGPDLKVYLSAHADPKSSSDVKGADWVSLGVLKGNVGDQSYTLPADVDIADFGSVVIWCEQFGVLFSPAVLS